MIEMVMRLEWRVTGGCKCRWVDGLAWMMIGDFRLRPPLSVAFASSYSGFLCSTSNEC
jgi:hypothetical protein